MSMSSVTLPTEFKAMIYLSRCNSVGDQRSTRRLEYSPRYMLAQVAGNSMRS